MNSPGWRIAYFILYALVGLALHSLAADDAAPDNAFPVRVSIKVPNPAWSIQIQKVYRVGDEYLVYSELSQENAIVIQVIVRASDEIQLSGPALPLRHIITGKTWSWENEGNITFAENAAAASNSIPKHANIVFSR